MNIEHFKESLNFMSTYLSNLQFLNDEKISILENSLIILQSENKFEKIFFWGCIQGVTNNYFIAFGYARDFLRDRRFFYSTNCYQWYLLPSVNLEQFEFCQFYPNLLQGSVTDLFEVQLVIVFIHFYNNESILLYFAFYRIRLLS